MCFCPAGGFELRIAFARLAAQLAIAEGWFCASGARE